MDSGTVGAVGVALAAASLLWQVFEARSRRDLDRRQTELTERQVALAEAQLTMHGETRRREELPAFEIVPQGMATNNRVVDWGIVVYNVGGAEARDVRLEGILPGGTTVRADEVHDMRPDPLRKLPYDLTFDADLADELGGAAGIRRSVTLRVFDRDGNEQRRAP